jgi:hypothetical protein
MHTQPLPSLRRRRRPPFRRPSARAILVLAGVALLSGALWFKVVGTGTVTVPLPWQARTEPSTPLQRHIVSAAESQVGYKTQPGNTRCNRYSAYWRAGDATCGNGNRDEQWCADFAAWVWQQGGAQVSYGTRPGQLNAVSFYQWGVARGAWHPAGSGYSPQPGDVAVYGLNTSRSWAQHVAVVTSYLHGARGPDVVNGDGTSGGFSVVETGTDQYQADVTGPGSGLSGYVSPS